MEVLSIFLVGIGMALTPCVWPMYPVLLSMVSGERQNIKSRAIKVLGFTQGLALSYVVIGLLLSQLGFAAQSMMQNDFVLLLSSLVLLTLGLSMLGVFEIRMPNVISNKIHSLTSSTDQNSFVFPFVTGLGSGLVLSPCTTAPLVAIAMFLSQSGEMAFGAISLYMLGLGASLPMWLLLIFGNKIKFAGWYSGLVSALIAFTLIGLALVVISPLLSPLLLLGLLSVYFISISLWVILAFELDRLMLPYVVALIVSVVATAAAFVCLGETESKMEQVTDIAQLEDRIEAEPLSMVMFTADWCAVCKKYKRSTFSSQNVEEALKGMAMFEVDLTNYDEAEKVLTDRLQVIGVPAMLFFKDGVELKEYRVVEYEAPDEFIERLNEVKQLLQNTPADLQ